jgi:glycosyltransferase involved in cell wall biosynthesis
LGPAILIISPEPWDAHAVSKHHYARVLAETGREVLFVDPPDLHPRRHGSPIAIRPAPGVEGVRVVSAPRVAAGLRFMPPVLRHWLEGRWLARLETEAGVEIGTVWLFENSRFFDMAFAGDRLKIYHQVDLNQVFHPELAAATADVCLCTTDFIRERLLAVRPDVHKIHHGTAVPRTAGDALSLQPFDVPGLHATYIGNLDMPYLDVDALAGLIGRFDHVTFHLVGGCDGRSRLFRRCGEAANAVWWGKLPFQQLASILERSDMLLVAYPKERQREQASPHKMMEYLLSGKVVVSSYTDEYKDKRHLLEMADPDQPIAEVFERVAADIADHNAEPRQAERRAFALDHVYEKQLGRIESIVREATGRQL